MCFFLVLGECTEKEVAEAFLSSFDPVGHDQQVSYVDFELYYEGLSIGIPSDQDFAYILQNTWAIWTILLCVYLWLFTFL